RLGTWAWWIDEGRVEWSDEIFRIYGLERGAFKETTASFLALVHPEDQATAGEAFARAAQDASPLELRHRIIRPTGEVRFVDVRAYPARDDGAGRRLAGTVHDVTQLVVAEETARAARAELRRQALHDALTSLPNRMLFLDRLAVALAHAERTTSAVAVIIVGLDRFGLINEELG